MEMGKLIFHGLDEEGNQVYTIGRGSSKAVIPAMRGVLELFEKNGKLQEKVIFSNTSRCAPSTSKGTPIGSIFSLLENKPPNVIAIGTVGDVFEKMTFS